MTKRGALIAVLLAGSVVGLGGYLIVPQGPAPPFSPDRSPRD
jgi:hypothetical protein